MCYVTFFKMWNVCVFILFFTISALAASQSVTVITKQLELDRTYDIDVNSTVEYILEFKPPAATALRVWASCDGGDVARPLLVVVRHATGARTLQLPYLAGGLLQRELERTLCTSDAAHAADAGDALALHVWTWDARSVRVRLRVSRAELLLPPDQTTHLTATIAAAAVRGYKWRALEGSTAAGGAAGGVLLRVDSDDDVCATIAVLPYNACPIEETLSMLSTASVRFTMLQNGGVHLQRSRFPDGFLIVGIVHPTDAACEEAGAAAVGVGEAGGEDELWERAVLGSGGTLPPRVEHARVKALRYTVMPAISPAQYAVAAASTLALLALFYVAFFTLVAAQRLPAFYRFVAPRKPLVTQDTESSMHTQVDGTNRATARQRRFSAATFDSSDNSDTEEEDNVTSSPIMTTPNVTSQDTTSRVSPSSERAPIQDRTDMGPNENGLILQHNSTAAQPQNVQENSVGQKEIAEVDVVDSVPKDNATQNRELACRAAATLPNGQPTDNTDSTITDQVPAGAAAAEAHGAATATAGAAFGLPAQLRLAALARRRERTLAARSQRYCAVLLTVGVFYALPVMQLVAAFQLMLNVSGSLDLCYYNFLCAAPAGALSDFNHVLSNVAYLLLGVLLLLAVRRRRHRRHQRPPPPDYGIPEHYGLMEALAVGMMMVALLSAAYHVCPNRLNFQFDTAFMYVLAVVSNVKMYQSRHPDVNARAHATFAVLAVLIAFGVWGVLGGGALFWALWTLLHLAAFLLLSLRVYYVGQWRLGAASMAATLRAGRPLYATRLAALAVANLVNWAFAMYGLVLQPADFAGHLLTLLLCNALLHMCYYLGMKLASGERLRWYSAALTGAAAAAWAPALYLFVSGSSDWSTSAARSRLRNHACLVLQFYDAHDLWHLLSAVALFLSFAAMLTWDDGLSAVRRDRIHVF